MGRAIARAFTKIGPACPDATAMAPRKNRVAATRCDAIVVPDHTTAADCVMSRVKVYYNSACPVCDAGIRSQKEKLATCGSKVEWAGAEWIDVHEDPARAAEVGADVERVRERLHVVDEAGRLRVGSEAFLTLWRLTPRQGWLATLFGAPLLRRLFNWSYNGFAALLYRWNRLKGRW